MRVLQLTKTTVNSSAAYSYPTEWKSFCEEAKRKSIKLPLPFADYEKLSSKEKQEIKRKRDNSGFIFGTFNNGTRKLQNLKSMEGICFDVDDSTQGEMENTLALVNATDWNYLMYTTASYNDKKACYRLIIPTDKPIDKDDYLHTIKGIAGKLKISNYDKTPPSQLYYWPMSLKDVNPFFKCRTDGAFLKCDFIKEAKTDPQPVDLEFPKLYRYEDEQAIKLIESYCIKENQNLQDRENYLPALMSLMRGVRENEISEEVGEIGAAMLACGNAEWEENNIKQFRSELNKTIPRTEYSFTARFAYKKETAPPPLIEPLVTAEYMKNAKYKPIKFFLEQIFPTGIGWIAGEPKIGKSILMLQIAQAIAAGERIFNLDANKTNVLYYNLEMDKTLFANRIKSILPPNGLDNLYIQNVGGTPIPQLGSGFEELLSKHIEQTKAQFIVIDPYVSISKNKSNQKPAYEESYKELTPLKQIADEKGVCIVMVTHYNKGIEVGNMSQYRIMGSTGNIGVSDFNIGLGKGKDENEYLLSLNSRKGASLDYVFNKALDGTFILKGELKAVERKKEIEQYRQNPIVIAIEDCLAFKNEVALSAQEIINAIPEEDIGELTTRKIGRRIQSLAADLKQYSNIRYWGQKQTGKDRIRKHIFTKCS